MATLEHEVSHEAAYESAHEATQEISIRLSREQAERLERAASASGQSVNDFAASALSGVADAALAPPLVRALSGRDFDYFLSLCDSEAQPPPALVKVMENYQRRLADGSLQVED